MDSLDTVTFMKKISFGFFAMLGAAHFLFGSLSSGGYFLPTSGLLMRILFTPFLLASLAYAYGVLKEHLLETGRKGKAFDYIFLTFTLIALLLSLFVEFYFPERKEGFNL